MNINEWTTCTVRWIRKKASSNIYTFPQTKKNAIALAAEILNLSPFEGVLKTECADLNGATA